MGKRKFDVEIKSKQGSCETPLFEKMVKNGDLDAIKVDEIVGNTITITGIAETTITTDDNEFDLNYYATEEYGLISSGSQFLLDSVKRYIEDTNKLIINKIKTKKGSTYKAKPIL